MQEKVSTVTLRYIQAVTEQSSFSAAARKFGVSQPTLSNAVGRLETQLGQRIFDRSPRGVTLTRFGDAVRPAVDRALGAVDDISDLAASWDNGEDSLRVGVSPLIDSSLVGAVLDRLRPQAEEYPPVLREDNLAGLVAALAAGDGGTGDLDVLLVPSVLVQPGLCHRIIASEPLVVVDLAATGTGPQDLTELEDRPMILVPDSCGLSMFTRSLFADNGVRLTQYPGEASPYRVLEEWAGLGLGAAVIPRSKLSSPDVPHRSLREGSAAVEIFYEMVWAPGHRLSEDFLAAADVVRRGGVETWT